MNIGEIARRAGVSRSTVSYTLSGKRAVSPQTRKRIQDVIDELGYRPNATARALAEGRSRTIGLVIPRPVSSSPTCSSTSWPASWKPPHSWTWTYCCRPQGAITTGRSNACCPRAASTGRS